MFVKFTFVAILGLFLGFLCIFWDSYVSPEVESDAALNQMELSDEAAVELRVASQTLAYQYPIAFIVWILLSLLIFRSEVTKGFLYFKENWK